MVMGVFILFNIISPFINANDLKNLQKIKILIVIDQHIKTIKIQNIIKQSILKFMP